MLAIAKLIRVAAVAIACLTVGEVSTVGPVEVRRTSLLGYEVAGTAGLAADEAVAVVADTQARIDAAKASARAADPFPRVGDQLVRAPYRVLGGRMSETWRGAHEDEAVAHRLRALRSSAVGPYVTQTTRRGHGFLAARVTTEITYPAGIAVPATETC